MRVPSRGTAGRVARRVGVRRRARALAGVVLAAAAAGCDAPRSGPVDPLCGAVDGALPMDGLRLERPADQAPLFSPVRRRRHTLHGHRRDTVSGFRGVSLDPRSVVVDRAGGRHVETVRGDLRFALDPVVLFAPRVRAPGAADWTDLPAVEGVARVEQGGRTFDVPAALDAPSSARVELELTVLASGSRSQHAWESAPVALPEDAVLAATIGALPAGADAGPVAWRVLACEGETCACVHAEVQDAADAARAGWQERRIALADFAGRSPTIRLETQALGSAAGTFDPGLWADPRIRRIAPADVARRPNVLLVSLDTLGADHLGLYGYPRETSPFIDTGLAPRGTTFMEALAPATTTGPSHMTLFTSLPPSVHGAVSNLGGRPLPEAVPTLASTLRAAGYATGAVTENGAITRSLGFGRGFDHYRENLSAMMVRPEGHIEETFAAGRHFLEHVRGMPWLLFVQTYQVHYPYTPPPAYADLFEDDGLDPPGTDALFSGGRARFHPVLYDREIRYADDRLRAFWTALEEGGWLDDTLVVVFGDHGEAFFEHRYLGHGADLHGETVRVPLIFVGPGVPAGRRIETRVGLADVMPTLLELLDVPAPAGMTGRSLVPLLEGEPGAEESLRRPIFSEAWQVTGVTRSGGEQVEQPTLAVQHRGYKLIRYREGAEGGYRHALFDLSRDPREQHDLLADGRRPEGEAARRLASLSELLDVYTAENARRAAGLGVVPDVAPEQPIDPERLEKLRALGYVE